MSDVSFKEFVLDQLDELPDVRARAMFGGHGVYSGSLFFAIIIEGRLYFKADELTRAAFIKRGMKPFTYTKGKKVLTMKYYEVPPDVLEDSAELTDWAKRAITVAQASRP